MLHAFNYVRGVVGRSSVFTYGTPTPFSLSLSLSFRQEASEAILSPRQFSRELFLRHSSNSSRGLERERERERGRSRGRKELDGGKHFQLSLSLSLSQPTLSFLPSGRHRRKLFPHPKEKKFFFWIYVSHCDFQPSFRERGVEAKIFAVRGQLPKPHSLPRQQPPPTWLIKFFCSDGKIHSSSSPSLNEESRNGTVEKWRWHYFHRCHLAAFSAEKFELGERL